jgi:integrase/recombinase XerD
MTQSLPRTAVARRQHCDAPFAVERDRYLRHCADHGSTSATLQQKRNELRWAARLLPPSAPQGVGMEECGYFSDMQQPMGRAIRG